MSNNKKPLGIVLISIYGAVSGLLSLLGGAALLLASAIPDMPLWISLLSFITTVVGILLLASVYGLWSLQSWGLSLTFWIYVISIPLGILAIFPIYPESEMSVSNTIIQLAGIAISALVITYIKKDKTKSLFPNNEAYA